MPVVEQEQNRIEYSDDRFYNSYIHFHYPLATRDETSSDMQIGFLSRAMPNIYHNCVNNLLPQIHIPVSTLLFKRQLAEILHNKHIPYDQYRAGFSGVDIDALAHRFELCPSTNPIIHICDFPHYQSVAMSSVSSVLSHKVDYVDHGSGSRSLQPFYDIDVFPGVYLHYNGAAEEEVFGQYLEGFREELHRSISSGLPLDSRWAYEDVFI
ncbi:hypothetical protein PSN45_001450 [Yamadazyma tenuis]|uniref:uncharacterized protein n=1 Tax=Candida tenuis TaxID=2315449 RepID=UPI0027A2C3F2|nr:hypothetical protein PSN45_001450 [Yamadazyma tenuis]